MTQKTKEFRLEDVMVDESLFESVYRTQNWIVFNLFRGKVSLNDIGNIDWCGDSATNKAQSIEICRVHRLIVTRNNIIKYER